MYASETKTSMTDVDQNRAGRPLRTRVKPLGQTQLGTQRLINLFQLKSKTRIGCWNVRTLFHPACKRTKEIRNSSDWCSSGEVKYHWRNYHNSRRNWSLQQVWLSRQLCLNTKLRIFSTNVKAFN